MEVKRLVESISARNCQ